MTAETESGKMMMDDHRGWTSIFETSSGRNSIDSSEASVNQPQAPDPAPHEPVAPVAPVDPEDLSDEIRRQELSDRLRINSIGRSYNLEVQNSIVEKLLLIERKIEQALLSDGYSKENLLEKRHQIRGFLFFPHGTPLSESTYEKHLKLMENYGTHRSLPYKRIMDAIYNKDLDL